MKRVATALVLVPAVAGLVLFGPFWAFLAVLALVGAAAHREFDALAARTGVEPSGWVGLACGVVLLVVPERMVLAAAIGSALLLVALALRLADLSRAMAGAGTAVLGVVYIFGAWRCALELRQIDAHWLMIALLVSWAGDTAALYVGKAWGRHKLAPRISPGKTWEGAVGSVVGGVLAAGVYAHYLIPAAGVSMVAGVAAAANVAGQAGDLAESAFKRGAGVKDSGSSLPGHGGWLDRIDSTLFAVPVTYGLVELLR